MKTKSFIQTVIFSAIAFGLASCKKTPTDNSGNGNNNGGGDSVVITPPTDPPIANTIGFFLNDWSPKSFTPPTYTDTTIPSATPLVFVNIDASTIITKVPGPVFGQNANVWMTPMISEPVLMNSLTNLHPNVIRFPGGSLSDVYFWNEPDGVKPTDAPDSLLDANGNAAPAGYWYGKVNFQEKFL